MSAPSPIADLSGGQVRALRLASLLLRPHPGVPAASSVADVVSWMGAMQAQDLASGLWSLGVRLPALDQAAVVEAMERREALRTWPMRGTVHLVPARDARWMVEILGERPLSQAAYRRRQIGLDDAVAERAVELIGGALVGGGRMRRSELLEHLVASGLPVSGQLGYHLLWFASQRGVTCMAPNVDGEHTFVLLDEWVPDPWRPEREEALATIATRFVRSHGPVPLKDFVGWTGLTVGDAKRGVAAAGAAIATVTCDGAPMLVDASLAAHLGEAPDSAGDRLISLLPAFDEFVLGYKDRSLIMTPEDMKVVVPGNNGIFQPTLVREGHVAGTWRRKRLTSRSRLEVAPLAAWRPDDAAIEATADAAAAYGRYLGEPVEVRWG